jgi:hypothetical protein
MYSIHTQKINKKKEVRKMYIGDLSIHGVVGISQYTTKHKEEDEKEKLYCENPMHKKQ